MENAVQNNGLESLNKNILLIKKNLKSISDIKIIDEYPNGNKYTILILSRNTRINENVEIFKDCH